MWLPAFRTNPAPHRHLDHTCRFIPSVGQRKGFEVLLRKLMLLPSQPAVIVVNWWAPRYSCTELIDDPKPGALGKCAQTLWNTTEDSMQELVDYYGVQSVSFRCAQAQDQPTTWSLDGLWVEKQCES